MQRVAALLELELTAAERAEVVRQAGFDYMKAHEERFTMSPPMALQRTGHSLRERRPAPDAAAPRSVVYLSL